MFVLTTLVYPVVLALLCLGGALLVDRASGGFLPAMLFPAVGAAALIVLSQLSTYLTPLAPATPYLLVALALAGLLLGRQRLRTLACAWRTSGWQLLVCPLAYVLALAPVLLAGRPTFSSYMALADSAVHMLGADYLIRHGQDYSHLDLRNSYGLFVHNYYGSSYPSGADTLFGGSSFLLGLPLIWTFQPFVAFMLATAAGPAWLLVRRVGLRGGWAALATLTITLPALVYAYELIGSVKEIAALALILCMGVLVVDHRRWLWNGARPAIPFALVVAAGVAALGIAFGAWALAASLMLAGVALVELRGGRVPRLGERSLQEPSVGDASANPDARGLLALFAIGLLVLLVAAWPTWAQLSGSLKIAQAIASTSNSGNLHSPLRPSQLFGVWLGGSYKLLPSGGALTPTLVLIALVLVLVVVGVGNIVRSRRYALAGWFAGMVIVWLALVGLASTWANAKTLMLTSPAVMLMAWAGIAALRDSHIRIAAALAAFLLVGGVLGSDVLLYHSSNLAPTARYEELASMNKRFAGRGPTLFTDFDEYSLYELRDMDVGGPDFVYPPPALAAAAGGYGDPVESQQDCSGGTAVLSADRHPPRPDGSSPAVRIPAAMAGRLLPGVGSRSECLARKAVWRSASCSARKGASCAYVSPAWLEALAQGHRHEWRGNAECPVRSSPWRRVGTVAEGRRHACVDCSHRRPRARYARRAARRQLARGQRPYPTP